MATDQAKGPKWQATPDDAIRLAAIRWFSATIEATAIQMYATNPARFEELEGVMRMCLGELGRLRNALADPNSDCPPGFVLCKDDVCAPMCEWFESAR